jgi:Holliday junction resolvase RusA-like endonuclease
VTLSFIVSGEPKPQGSKRGFVTKHGRVALVEQAGKPLKEWRDRVAQSAVAARIASGWAAYAAEPMGVSLVFSFKRPLRPKHPVPAVRPDIDKLTRAVLDAVTDAHVWQDDGQVISLRVEKIYGEPGVSVRVWKM